MNKPKITNGGVDAGEGKIVSTELNKKSGLINTPGTYKDYK